jgi:ketosteroid isomerase-like protein
MKAKHLLLPLACAALSLTAGPAHAQQPASLKAKLSETNRRYFAFFQHKDAHIVDLYTEDACLMPPNAPAICGKVALAKDFTDTYAAGQVSGVKFHTQQVYGAGTEYVTEQGTWQVFDANGKVIDDGKYLKIWKKTSAGWKIFRDVFNSDHKS